MMNKILEAFNILEDIESSSGTLAKQSILTNNQYNEVLVSLLKATYDPFKRYHVKKYFPPDPTECRDMSYNYTTFMTILKNLSDRVLSGNSALEVIDSLMVGLSPVELKWYYRVLTKDLDIGIQAKTINKCIPGLITVFEVQLAKELDRYPNRITIEPKLDGMRLIGSTSTGLLFSRTGKLVTGFDDIEASLLSLPGGLFIDGEIEVNGKFNATMTQAFRKSSGKKGIFNVFDVISQEEFESGESKKSQVERAIGLKNLLRESPSDLIKNIASSEVIDTSSSDYLEIINNRYLEFLDLGYEGAMIKDADASYQRKRSRNWQKLKPIKTYDLRVIGIEPGSQDSKWADGLGKLVCDFKGQEVRVSGMSEAQRMAWANDPKLILGKVVEVIGQEDTENKKGTSSIRFPRFKSIRLDKE